jgi:DNA-binding winged helix-turn-helix (wHTH) protein/Tol biopolymer transport system component
VDRETAPLENSSEREAAYTFGAFRVNLQSLELLKNGEPVSLTPKTFDTLLVLLRHHDRVVTKDELLKAVWRDAVVSDDSLSQCISSLRRTLGDDSNQPEFIATIPRRGYRFIAPVARILIPPPDAPETPPVVTAAPAEAAVRRGTARGPARRVWVPVVATALALAAGLAAGYALRPVNERALKLNLQPPFGAALASGAVIAPNGGTAAFVAEEGRSGHQLLWVQSLDNGGARALPGTEGAAQPFWSPDSQSLGFFAGGALKTVSIAAGPPVTLATIGLVPAGASWSRLGTIVFAGFRSSINAVPDTGGTNTPVSSVDTAAGDLTHEWPQFLPDGRRLLYSVDSASPDRAGTYIAALDGEAPRRLVADQHAVYAPPGYLVFVRDRALMAQPFDIDRGEVTGTPRMVAGNVSEPTVRNGGTISSAPGLLAFGGGTAGGRLAWLNRAGQMLGPVNTSADLHNPALIDKRNQVLLDGGGVWSVDLQRGTTMRVVADGSTPVPSPDGTRVVFDAVRASGITDLYIRSLDSNEDELLLHTSENKLANDWTRDGRYVVFVSRNPKTGRDIWLLPMMTGDRTPVAFSTGPGNEIQAQVSPDGRWIAYASDESGSWQVYVQSFPNGGNKRAVSAGGGGKPQWRADGRELFYLTPDRMVMAAPVSPDGGIGRSQALFQAPVVADLATYRSQFAVTEDGQRFLFDVAEPGGGREPVTVLVNWTSLLAQP